MSTVSNKERERIYQYCLKEQRKIDALDRIIDYNITELKKQQQIENNFSEIHSVANTLLKVANVKREINSSDLKFIDLNIQHLSYVIETESWKSLCKKMEAYETIRKELLSKNWRDDWNQYFSMDQLKEIREILDL